MMKLGSNGEINQIKKNTDQYSANGEILPGLDFH